MSGTVRLTHIDLSEDLRVALSSVPQGAASASTELGLCGLYRIRATGTPLEIEFTETPSLKRSAAYLTGGDMYFSLPDAVYELRFKRLGPLQSENLSLSFTRLGVRAKLELYAAKLLHMGLDPQRWLSALKSRRKSRNAAIGLSIDTPAPPLLTPPTNLRPIEVPATSSAPVAVSIIIPTKTRPDMLRACLESLNMITETPFEVIIIDNGATDPDMLALLAQQAALPDRRVIRHDIPFNFSRLCNLGAELARYPLLLFLNDGVEALDADWLGTLSSFAVRDDVGAVGARLLYASRDLQHAGIAAHLLPGPGHPWRSAPENLWRTHLLLCTAGEVDAVTGACLMIRRDLFQKLSGFDEARFAITLNDVDLCLRVRQAGLKVIFTPDATPLHKEGQSRPADDRPEEKARRDRELRAFVALYPDLARSSVLYPEDLRRDTDTAIPI